MLSLLLLLLLLLLMLMGRNDWRPMSRLVSLVSGVMKWRLFHFVLTSLRLAAFCTRIPHEMNNWPAQLSEPPPCQTEERSAIHPALSAIHLPSHTETHILRAVVREIPWLGETPGSTLDDGREDRLEIPRASGRLLMYAHDVNHVRFYLTAWPRAAGGATYYYVGNGLL
ncbi:hypothetical protein LX32DRAFT_656919 [Colletotrichum zoysiae]|uniref:Secreted protein n=1 Tax=Colletotrichum zoysiae TaxID=1216348 RepID=A0AAD9H820_9PEZI|nr:hypothetical protein LX32DRAFT_656919 [Colletotrichum zoysiae]